MNKKVWNAPELLELDAKNTEHGGSTFTTVDGEYVEVGGTRYWPSAS